MSRAAPSNFRSQEMHKKIPSKLNSFVLIALTEDRINNEWNPHLTFIIYTHLSTFSIEYHTNFIRGPYIEPQYIRLDQDRIDLLYLDNIIHIINNILT